MRNFLDRILRSGIKLCLLTGVAFTFAACYGTTPEKKYWNEPDFQQDQKKMEQQLSENGNQEVY